MLLFLNKSICIYRQNLCNSFINWESTQSKLVDGPLKILRSICVDCVYGLDCDSVGLERGEYLSFSSFFFSCCMGGVWLFP